jgi:hypothetical protein
MSGMIGMARVGARTSPRRRLAVRQIDSAPLLSDLRNWFETARLPGRSPTAEAISYALNRPGMLPLRGVGDLADPWPVTVPWRIEPLEPAARSRKAIEPVPGFLPASDVWAVFPTGRPASAKARAFAMFMAAPPLLPNAQPRLCCVP